IDKRNEPVIMDFGLVLQVGQAKERITKSGTALGTPAYMPPEQLRGATAEMGPRSDVYSLGVVLYELLSGHLPFEGPYYVECAQTVTQDPRPTSTHRSELDLQVEAICLKAMARQAGDRFGSMRDLAAALAGYLRSRGKLPGPIPSSSLTPVPSLAGTAEE